MNFKTTLILLLLLVAAGGYVAWDRVKSADKDKVKTVAQDPKKLFDLKNKDDVTSMTITSADGNQVVLAKADGKWRMTKPVEAAAEGWQVDGLVRDLVDLEATATVDPKDKGLDKPKFRIEIAAKNGKLLKFAIGDKTQLGQMFVRVEGQEQARVVSADVYDRLSKPADELRDKQLIAVSSADIKQLTIQTGNQKVALQKNGTAWEVTEPKKLPADESAVTDLLVAVTGLRASDWVAKDSAEVSTAAFDKPQMTVAFTTAAPATQPATAPASQPAWITVTFGRYEDISKEKVYARLSDSQAVVKVASTPLTTLNKKPIELRDKKVLDVLPEQVSKLSIATDVPAGPAPTVKPGKKSLVEIVRRKEVAQAATKPAATGPATTQATQPTTQTAAAKEPASKWELKSDPKGDADDEAITSLLTELHPLRAMKFNESNPTTRPTAGYTVKLTTEGPGGTPVTDYEVKLVDPGNDQPLLAEYNGLSFELPRTFLTKLEGNFAKKPKVEGGTGGGGTPAKPEDFKLPGEQ